MSDPGTARDYGSTALLTPALPLPDELSAEYLEFNRVLPLSVEADRVRIAAVGTPGQHVIEDLTGLYGLPVEIVPVGEPTLLDGIRRATAANESVVELVKDLNAEGRPFEADDETAPADARDLANQPPVVRFVSLLIREAHETEASDIHLDVSREGLRIRVDVVRPGRYSASRIWNLSAARHHRAVGGALTPSVCTPAWATYHRRSSTAGTPSGGSASGARSSCRLAPIGARSISSGARPRNAPGKCDCQATSRSLECSEALESYGSIKRPIWTR